MESRGDCVFKPTVTSGAVNSMAGKQADSWSNFTLDFFFSNMEIEIAHHKYYVDDHYLHCKNKYFCIVV